MPRVLFIAYDYPPAPGIGAGLRSAAFVRHLPTHGWWPQVIALDQGQPMAAGITRLPSATPWHRPYELGPYGWAWSMHRHLARCDAAALDLVYVSCPPFPQALAAARYARRHCLPLVVDFRDAWSLDPYQEGSRLKRWLYRHLFPHWERRLLAGTDLLLLNTPSALSVYRTHYPEFADRMAWLPNGFHEDDFAAVVASSCAADELVMLHAGRFGIGARTPDHLLQALAGARRQGCRVRLDILGAQPDWLAPRVAATGLGDAVRLLGQVPYGDAVARMSAADVLVLVQAPSDAAIQAVAGKTYDYLRAGRPVLAIVPPGDNLDLVHAHVARHECPADTVPAIAEAITRLYRDWQAGALPVGPQVDPAFQARFERAALSAELASHFDRLLGRTAP